MLDIKECQKNKNPPRWKPDGLEKVEVIKINKLCFFPD